STDACDATRAFRNDPCACTACGEFCCAMRIASSSSIGRAEASMPVICAASMCGTITAPNSAHFHLLITTLLFLLTWAVSEYPETCASEGSVSNGDVRDS